MAEEINDMIHKYDDCRVLAIPNKSRSDLRWSIDLAISALEREFGLERGQSVSRLAADEQAHLKRLDALRIAIHEDY